MATRGAAMPKRWRSFHTRGTRLRITRSGHHRHLIEAFSLGQAEHQVHVLHCLARSALDEVVDDRKYDQRIGPAPAFGRAVNCHSTYVLRAYRTGLGMAAPRDHIGKRLARVALLEQGLEVGFARYPRIQRSVDTANERGEVRREYKPHFTPRRLGQPLSDFRPVPVPGHVVG